MKALAAVFLAVIAAGVTYLAWSDYQQRRAASDFVDRASDPDGYAARDWASRAGLDCEIALNVEAVTTSGGFRRPMKFTCVPSNVSDPILYVVDVECPPDDQAIAGRRTPQGLYKPLETICWKAEPSQSFVVAWPPVSGAVTYRLDERAAEGSWLEIQAGPQTSRAITGKPPGVWEYRVRACSASECGSYQPLPSVRVD